MTPRSKPRRRQRRNLTQRPRVARHEWRVLVLHTVDAKPYVIPCQSPRIARGWGRMLTAMGAATVIQRRHDNTWVRR